MQSINYTRHNEIWTPEESKQLIQLARSGKSFTDLVPVFQRTMEAIKLHYFSLSSVYAPQSSKPIPRSKWKKQEEDSLLKLRQQNYSFVEIAKILGRSAAACQIKSYDLKPTPIKSSSSSNSKNEPPANDLFNHGKPWLPEETEKLLQVGDDSPNWHQIAKQFGRKVDTVRNKYMQLKRLLKNDTGDFHQLFQENAASPKRKVNLSSIDTPAKKTKTRHAKAAEELLMLSKGT